jgi:putative phosphoserine phosphatase/1-acylglycerol-3-phosphate O-acyltransferase
MSTMAERLAEIEAAPAGAKTVAFFDFDGTIIDGYSASAMLKRRAREGDLGPLEFTRLLLGYVEVSAGRQEFDAFMRGGVRALAGKPEADVRKLGDRLLRSALGGALFKEAWALVAAHRERGHRIVLATSALPFQVEPLAEELGADDVLCTRLAVRHGVLTGEVDGAVLWGSGKADAVKGYARSKRVSLKRCFAYGNGGEDLEYLSLVGHPRPVNADAELAAAAAQRGWPVTAFEHTGGPGLQEIVRTAATYGSMAVSLAGGVAVSLLNRRRREGVNLTIGVGSDVALSLAGVQVDVTGAEHLWSHRPAVFIFNHQSWLDGFIIMKLLRQDVTGVSKAEVAGQPGLGQFAKFLNMAFIDRADGARAREALGPVVDRIEEGYSIVLAPEGTRSITPRVGPFKKGAFHMAMQGGVPVVPIVIRNAGELLWRGSTFMRPGTVDVHVLPPVPTGGWTLEDLDARVSAVRQDFVDTLAHWPSSGGRTKSPPAGDASPAGEE